MLIKPNSLCNIFLSPYSSPQIKDYSPDSSQRVWAFYSLIELLTILLTAWTNTVLPRHSYVNHTATTALLITAFCATRSSHYESPCLYSWWQHHLATRIHVFMPESTHIATGVLAFIPDSTKPFHWETSYLYLIASPWPGWGARWYCHRNHLFIPDRTFRESVNFQVQKSEKTA